VARADGKAATEEKGDPVAEFEASPPAWLRPIRRRVHRFPGGRAIWKIIIGSVGGAIVFVGALLIPLPGPGWAIVFLGIALWATEFQWAHRLLQFGRIMLRRWTDWALRQALWVRGLIGVAGLAFLAAVFYALSRLFL
jgi:uncharacterized protein (TIGR02611 family)